MNCQPNIVSPPDDETRNHGICGVVTNKRKRSNIPIHFTLWRSFMRVQLPLFLPLPTFFVRGRFFFASIAIALMAGCQTAPPLRGPSDTRAPDPRPSDPAPIPPVALTPTLRQLVNDSANLAPLAKSDLARRFLSATAYLTPVASRTVFLNEQTREYFSAAEAGGMPEIARARLNKAELDEYRYYYTKYGSPLAYMRALDVAASAGITDIAGRRVLDFGYGSIGHLRLMASLGANVTGVDPDSYLSALYSDAYDQGPYPLPNKTPDFRGTRGSVTLAHGSFPKDARIADKVGRGYDLILTKNTLKRGYIKPERKAEKRHLIDLGVSDEVFLNTIASVLNPGGKLVIYNIYPTPSGPKEVYKPFADGRSPFTREQYERAGLRVLAFELDDSAAIRQIGRVLRWDKNDKGEIIDSLDTNLFAMYTVVERAR